jgi:hypothetical protein
VEYFEAAPDSDPAGLAVGPASEDADERGHRAIELVNGGFGPLLMLGQVVDHFEPRGWHDFGRGAIGMAPRYGLQLKQPHHHRGPHAGRGF